MKTIFIFIDKEDQFIANEMTFSGNRAGGTMRNPSKGLKKIALTDNDVAALAGFLRP